VKDHAGIGDALVAKPLGGDDEMIPKHGSNVLSHPPESGIILMRNNGHLEKSTVGFMRYFFPNIPRMAISFLRIHSTIN